MDDDIFIRSVESDSSKLSLLDWAYFGDSVGWSNDEPIKAYAAGWLAYAISGGSGPTEVNYRNMTSVLAGLGERVPMGSGSGPVTATKGGWSMMMRGTIAPDEKSDFNPRAPAWSEFMSSLPQCLFSHTPPEKKLADGWLENKFIFKLADLAKTSAGRFRFVIDPGTSDGTPLEIANVEFSFNRKPTWFGGLPFRKDFVPDAPRPVPQGVDLGESIP